MTFSHYLSDLSAQNYLALTLCELELFNNRLDACVRRRNSLADLQYYPRVSATITVRVKTADRGRTKLDLKSQRKSPEVSWLV